jgi:hypothetical protein
MSSITVKMGGKEQIYSAAFLMLDDQDVEMEVAVPTAPLRMAIRFTPGEPNTVATGRWEVVAGVTRFTFSGWSSPFTTAIPAPERFGELNGRALYFQVAQRKIGKDLNEVHWWVLVEAQP